MFTSLYRLNLLTHPLYNSMEMQREWSALSQIGALTLYGDPFLSHSTGPRSKPEPTAEGGGLFSFLSRGSNPTNSRIENWDQPLDPPLLSYEFFRFIQNLPCLREAPLKYWQDRIQPFFDSFAERNLSNTKERSEVTKRRMLAMGFTRILGT